MVWHTATHYITGTMVDISVGPSMSAADDVSSCTAASNGMNGCVFTGMGSTASFSLTSASITNVVGTTITATSINLSATMGDIGSEDNPIVISSGNDDTDGTFTSLLLAAPGSIYIRRASRVLEIFNAGTFSISHGHDTRTDGTPQGVFLYQTNGAIATHGNIISTTLVLTVDPTMANAFTLRHNLNVRSFTIANSSEITSTAGSITAGTLLSLTSVGDIGSAGNPLTIARTTGNWTATNLPINAGSGIFLRTVSAGAHTAIPLMYMGNPFAGTFSLEQTAGNIDITDIPPPGMDLNLPGATIALHASGTVANITFGDKSIMASSLRLMATGTLTGTTGTLTAGSITLSVTGNVGSVSVPIRIEHTSMAFGEGGLTLSSGNGIYLETASTGAHAAVLPASFSGSYTLVQTAGGITFSGDITVPRGTISFDVPMGGFNFGEHTCYGYRLYCHRWYGQHYRRHPYRKHC